MVHGEEVVGVEMVGHGPGLLGGGVGGEVGVVAADAQDGEIDLADFAEVILICGVAAIEDAGWAGLDEVSVEAAVIVVEGSRRPSGRPFVAVTFTPSSDVDSPQRSSATRR